MAWVHDLRMFDSEFDAAEVYSLRTGGGGRGLSFLVILSISISISISTLIRSSIRISVDIISIVAVPT